MYKRGVIVVSYQRGEGEERRGERRGERREESGEEPATASDQTDRDIVAVVVSTIPIKGGAMQRCRGRGRKS